MHATSVGKAGLPQDYYSKEKIKKRVEEISKGSKFWKQKQEKEARQTRQNENYKENISNLIKKDKKLLSKGLTRYKEKIWKAKEELNEQILHGKIIVHVDMDSFFASVEMLKLNWTNEQMQTIPLAVGGIGMLSTANYAARKYGCRSAMPGFIAKKLCPNLMIVPCDFLAYKEKSRLAQEIFEQYSPVVVMASLDEAYLDLTDHVRERERKIGEEVRQICHHCAAITTKTPISSDSETCCEAPNLKMPETFDNSILKSSLEEMRLRVKIKTKGLTCSAGASINTFIAKCLSDKAKPNGSKIMNNQTDIIDFMRNLPIGRCNGIGPVSEKFLKDVYDVEFCKDITDLENVDKNAEDIGAKLCLPFERTDNSHYIRTAMGVTGLTDLKYMSGGIRKGMGHETTLYKSLDMVKDKKEIWGIIEDLAETIVRGYG